MIDVDLVQSTEVPAAVIALVCMALDVLTGFLLAVKEHDVSSSKMREGLWHKLSWVLFALVAAITQIGGMAIPLLGSALEQIGLTVDAVGGGAVIAVCVLCICNELVSILENICAMNPEINDKIGKVFRNDPRIKQAHDLIDDGGTHA